MGQKEEIKSIIVKSGFTMIDVVNKINENTGRTETPSNFSNKLRRGTLKYKEAEDIAEAIGYRIKWLEK